MSVITISNERGSQGSLIAETVARTLGYHLANQTLVETMLKDYGLVEFHEEYRSIPGFWDRLDADKRSGGTPSCRCSTSHCWPWPVMAMW